MEPLPRWTLEEVYTRYENLPHLRDAFLEGAYDCDILQSATPSEMRRDLRFYSIDVVCVPSDLVREVGLTDGNKQRVIALATHLAKLGGECSYWCLVDRDLDQWFGRMREVPRLKWTAGTSIEMYFLDTAALRTILELYAKVRTADVAVLVGAVVSTLRQLFAIRLACHEMRLETRWIALRGCLTKTAGVFRFDRKKFIGKLMDANGSRRSEKAVVSAMEGWDTKLIADPRAECHVDDLLELMGWTIRSFGGQKELAKSEVLQRLFVVMAPQVTALVALARGDA